MALWFHLQLLDFASTEGGSLTPVRDGPCTPRLRSVSSYGNIRAVTTARNLNKSLQNLSLNEECKRHCKMLSFPHPLYKPGNCTCQTMQAESSTSAQIVQLPAPRAYRRSPLITSFNFLVISIDFSECLWTKKVLCNSLTSMDF